MIMEQRSEMLKQMAAMAASGHPVSPKGQPAAYGTLHEIIAQHQAYRERRDSNDQSMAARAVRFATRRKSSLSSGSKSGSGHVEGGAGGPESVTTPASSQGSELPLVAVEGATPVHSPGQVVVKQDSTEEAPVVPAQQGTVATITSVTAVTTATNGASAGGGGDGSDQRKLLTLKPYVYRMSQKS